MNLAIVAITAKFIAIQTISNENMLIPTEIMPQLAFENFIRDIDYKLDTAVNSGLLTVQSAKNRKSKLETAQNQEYFNKRIVSTFCYLSSKDTSTLIDLIIENDKASFELLKFLYSLNNNNLKYEHSKNIVRMLQYMQKNDMEYMALDNFMNKGWEHSRGNKYMTVKQFIKYLVFIDVLKLDDGVSYNSNYEKNQKLYRGKNAKMVVDLFGY
jgi:hypothetical protein